MKEVWAVKVWEPVVGAVQNCWQKGDCSEAISWFKLAIVSHIYPQDTW